MSDRVRTQRIVELLNVLSERGYWTPEEQREAEEVSAMGREAGYIPEGTEDWMQEEGVPRAYDKPKRTHHLPEEIEGLGRERPPETTAFPPGMQPAEDARLKTIEATLTDVMSRLKVLEAKAVDPSA
jgi:hypothetical protein